MFLTQLQLRNWRSYRNASFVFPVPDRAGKKNVVLVGAQNGVGKTSFLMALYLGMFGREAMSLIEGFRSRGAAEDKFLSYQKLIESVLHRPAKNQDDPHCSVTLKFQIDEGEVIITRRWLYRPGGKVRDLESNDGEEVVVEVDGRKKLYPNWKDANARIEELLFPCNVMPCLFFDGEQAQERVEAAGGRALFDAVKALYGTGILEHLSESLRSYIANERGRLQKDFGSIRLDELEQKRQELDAQKDQLKTVQSLLANERKERTDTEERRKQVEGNLYSMVGDKAADIEEYSSTISALQEEELRLKQQMVAEVGSLALPLALNRSAWQLVSTIQTEQVRAKWLLLKDEAAGKASSIVESVLPSDRAANVSPPLLETQATQLRAALEKALEALWSPPPDGCATTFKFKFLHDNDRPMVISKIKKGVAAGPGSLADTALELHAITTKLEETRLRFERTRDIQPALQKLKIDLQEVLDKHREISGAVSGFEHQERGLQQTISELRAAIGQMENRQEAGSPIQEKLDTAQRLRSLVENASEKLVPLCRDALEEACTKHFAAMISGEYARFKARFATDSEPWLESPNGQQILVSSLSGAQKRVFGLAFTLAVADVSQTEAPIVIDTPVGNMDSEYRARVLKYVAAAAPGQVIFLSHNEEIYGQYVEAIAPRIRKKFLVSFERIEDGAGVSAVADDQYFEV